LDSVLIRNEAAVNRKDNNGFTASDYAFAFGDDKYQMLFLRNNETLQSFQFEKLDKLKHNRPNTQQFVDMIRLTDLGFH